MSEFAGRDLACIRAERLVFRGVSFSLGAGDALRLSGPNGSGKSSLIRIMAGLLRAAEGEMTWDGRAIRDDPDAHRGRLRYVGHLDAVKPVLTVAEDLVFWAGLSGAGGDPAAAAGRGLSAFGLASLADIPCRMLSAGQRRRLALARLETGPAMLWLLDEPTVGLDSQSVATLEAAVARHLGGGGIVVLATHTDFGLGPAAELDLADHGAPPGAAAAQP